METPATNRPTPPDDLDGEALLEWHRVIAELDALGTLHAADRAIITLHCQTWDANQRVAKHVAKWGPIAVGHNKVIGRTPHFSAMLDTAKVLEKTTKALGLTPASRPAATIEEADTELKF